jgi:molecular chaperone GrpE
VTDHDGIDHDGAELDGPLDGALGDDEVAADPAAILGDDPVAPGGTTELDLATALAQRDEFLTLARQVQADFENFRKRSMKQQADQVAAASGRLVESLLPVLDACDSAIAHGVDGVEPVQKQLLDVLGKSGLEVIATDGVTFDPTVHEAVLHEPAAEGEEGGEPRIVEVLRTGYLWQGRTLRAAMVKVRD